MRALKAHTDQQPRWTTRLAEARLQLQTALQSPDVANAVKNKGRELLGQHPIADIHLVWYTMVNRLINLVALPDLDLQTGQRDRDITHEKVESAEKQANWLHVIEETREEHLEETMEALELHEQREEAEDNAAEAASETALAEQAAAHAGAEAAEEHSAATTTPEAPTPAANKDPEAFGEIVEQAANGNFPQPFMLPSKTFIALQQTMKEYHKEAEQEHTKSSGPTPSA